MSERLEHRLSPPVGDGDHAQGPADAPVTLVEYGDFECPYCGRAYPIVKAVQAHFGPRLRFVFRNFPLTESHPHAAMAAASAEAAGDHGKFWEMHDLLFEHQDHLNEIRSPDEAHRVREDFMSGVRSGVNGTPTFFINGVRHDGSWDFQGLVDAVGASMREGGAMGATAPSQEKSRRRS
jgi:protein-disulfide isomerase